MILLWLLCFGFDVSNKTIDQESILFVDLLQGFQAARPGSAHAASAPAGRIEVKLLVTPTSGNGWQRMSAGGSGCQRMATGVKYIKMQVKFL